ncbi:MAG: metal ABC transporter permease, partial [Alphaproteobacteria bacterium]|nr:metal ABC transporter permease [Alphaproteobacteria bacterium]
MTQNAAFAAPSIRRHMIRPDQGESSDPEALDLDEPALQPDSDQQLSESTLINTIGHLWPYIWPRGRRDLELRVAAVFALLVLSKLFNAATP